MAHFARMREAKGKFSTGKKITKLAWFVIMNSCAALYQRENASASTQASACFCHQNVTSIQVKDTSNSEIQHVTTTSYVQLPLISRAQQSRNSEHRIADVRRQ